MSKLWNQKEDPLYFKANNDGNIQGVKGGRRKPTEYSVFTEPDYFAPQNVPWRRANLLTLAKAEEWCARFRRAYPHVDMWIKGPNGFHKEWPKEATQKVYRVS